MAKDILFERATNMMACPTKAEKIFLDLLEIHNINYKFQWIIGTYIVDFLIGKTVVELDGSSHEGREMYDEIRSSYLRENGYTVIRVLNKDAINFNFRSLKGKQEKIVPPEEKITLTTNGKFVKLELLATQHTWYNQLPKKQSDKIAKLNGWR